MFADLQNVVTAVQRQLRVEHSALDAEGLQKQPQTVAFINAVDEEQHFALHQAQLQQHHHMQQLVFPAKKGSIAQLSIRYAPSQARATLSAEQNAVVLIK